MGRSISGYSLAKVRSQNGEVLKLNRAPRIKVTFGPFLTDLAKIVDDDEKVGKLHFAVEVGKHDSEVLQGLLEQLQHCLGSEFKWNWFDIMVA